MRNGTQSSLAASGNAYYFVGRRVYRGALSLGYQLETRQDTVKNTLMEVTNKAWKVGVEMEVPYRNYPIFKLHEKTRYARLAMPHAKFVDPLAGMLSDARYDSVALAQDLDVAQNLWGILSLLAGIGRDGPPRGQHFIFYRVSSGRKARSFADVREQSFGFGTYF